MLPILFLALQDSDLLRYLPERVVLEVEARDDEGCSERAAVTFNLEGPQNPIPTFEQEVVEVELVSSLLFNLFLPNKAPMFSQHAPIISAH